MFLLTPKLNALPFSSFIHKKVDYRFYPECDVRLDHQSKVEDFSKCLMYSHAPGILIISRCFSTKNWFLIYPASIGDTLRNPPHYSDGRVKHHIQGRSDNMRSTRHGIHGSNQSFATALPSIS